MYFELKLLLGPGLGAPHLLRPFFWE